MLTILCIATYFKGEPFLRECRRQGCRVLLLTSDALAGAAWPREAIDDVYSIARVATDAVIDERVQAIDVGVVEPADRFGVPARGRTQVATFTSQPRPHAADHRFTQGMPRLSPTRRAVSVTL